MRVAAFETSSDTVSVALLDTEADSVIEREASARRERGKVLLPFLEELLAERGWTLRDVELLAVGVGPGSYTGVRIGLSLAKGISFGGALPIRGINSLEALAADVPADRATSPLLATSNAFRGEVFAGLFAPRSEPGDPLERLQDDSCAPPEELARHCGPEFLAIGDGAEAHAETLTQAGVNVVTGLRPRARHTAKLAWRAWQEEGPHAAVSLVPIHLRSVHREFKKVGEQGTP